MKRIGRVERLRKVSVCAVFIMMFALNILSVLPVNAQLYNFYSVRVLDENFDPLIGASVTVGTLTDYAGAGGYMNCSLIGQEDMPVTVEAVGYKTYHGYFTTNNNQNYLVVVLQVEYSRYVTFKVFNNSTFNAIGGALVNVTNIGSDYTDEDGKITGWNLVYASYLVTVTKVGYYPSEFIIIVNAFNYWYNVSLAEIPVSYDLVIDAPPMAILNETGLYFRKGITISVIRLSDDNIDDDMMEDQVRILQEDSHGNYHIAWSEWNNTLDYTQAFYSNSTNGGLTWCEPYLLNPQSTPDNTQHGLTVNFFNQNGSPSTGYSFFVFNATGGGGGGWWAWFDNAESVLYASLKNGKYNYYMTNGVAGSFIQDGGLELNVTRRHEYGAYGFTVYEGDIMATVNGDTFYTPAFSYPDPPDTYYGFWFNDEFFAYLNSLDECETNFAGLINYSYGGQSENVMQLVIDKWNNLDIMTGYYIYGDYIDIVKEYLLSNTTKTFSIEDMSFDDQLYGGLRMQYGENGVRHYVYGNYTNTENGTFSNLYYFNSTDSTPINITNEELPSNSYDRFGIETTSNGYVVVTTFWYNHYDWNELRRINGFKGVFNAPVMYATNENWMDTGGLASINAGTVSFGYLANSVGYNTMQHYYKSNFAYDDYPTIDSSEEFDNLQITKDIPTKNPILMYNFDSNPYMLTMATFHPGNSSFTYEVEYSTNWLQFSLAFDRFNIAPENYIIPPPETIDDVIILSQFRLTMFIIGFLMFVVPPITWFQGIGRHASWIASGLLSMLFGMMIMINIQYMTI